jgi:hypothetical protein
VAGSGAGEGGVRLAVVGSRDYPDEHYWRVRNDILEVGWRVGWENLVIVSGGARGADTMAQRAAKEFQVPFEVYPADWKRHGKRAGFLRNQQIVDAADELLGYFTSKDHSPGTADTVRRAVAKGIPVYLSADGERLAPICDDCRRSA